MKDVIETAIADALAELGLTEVDFVVEHPAELAHGDYASNVALVAAKQLGQAPSVVAEQLRAMLEGQIEYVDSITIAGPGFINFTLAREFLAAETARARTQGWGEHDSEAGKRIIVEYTDPNPFKEFHIGHLFTNAVGESIARLFMFAGADVKRVNYQGDVGLHVACALYGMHKLGLTTESEFTARDLGRAYATGATAYKEDEIAQTTIRNINKQVYERSDELVNELYDKGRTVSLAYFEDIYALLGTKFDEYFFESEAGPLGKELVLAHPNVFPESDGARVFKGEEYGLHTRVFLNKEGLPTYEAKELALAKLKQDRLGVYDHSVISTAREISEYFKVLLSAMGQVYPELAAKTEHIGHGMVRLKSGKMSSRTGDVIVALDFIEEVAISVRTKMSETVGVDAIDSNLANDIAVGAIKYATLKSSISQDSIFDAEQALSFEGDSGPYLMYTHARICSVLEKAAAVGVSPSANAPATPYELERILYRLPEVVEAALAERAPHKVASFLIELAGTFNTFYANEKIADPADEYAPYKATLADAVRQTLHNGLYVLGIKAPTKM